MTFFRLCFGCIVQTAPFAYLCFYPFGSHFRFSKRKTILLTIAVIAGCALVFSIAGTFLASILPGNHVLFQAVNLLFMLCLLPCLYWYINAIRAIWQKKLFIFSFALTSALSITSICNTLCTWFYLDKPSDGLPYEGYTSIFIFGVTALLLPLLRLLLKKYYLPIEDDLSAKENGHLSILSLLLFLVLASGLSFISYDNFYKNPLDFFLFFSLLASIFVIYLLYFKIYLSAHEKYLTQSKYLKIQYDMQLLGEQYQQINENVENSRRMRHDLKHHMLTLQGYLNRNETEEAKNYIQQYIKEVQEYELLKFCEHQVIQMLVNYYYSFAREQGIGFIVHINIPKELSISDSDLSVLLGNLLENAVNAAAAAPQKHRHINLNIICHRKMLAITVDNSFDGKVMKNMDGQYLSTKPGHIGIGLKSITDIAEKYNGGIDFKHDDHEFHSYVMLGLN